MAETLVSFQDFEQKLAGAYDELGASKEAEYKRLSDGLPYLDPLTQSGGVLIARLDEATARFDKSCRCGTSAMLGTGQKTGKKYLKWNMCRKWWCPTCGKVGGVINKRRVSQVMRHLGRLKRGEILREIVLTVPQDCEGELRSRKAINMLNRLGVKIVEKFFPERRAYVHVHPFGDRREMRYRPHVNVLVMEKAYCKKKLTPEFIDEIKETWRAGIRGFLRRPVYKCVGHVSWAEKDVQYNHMLRYVTRPVPGPRHFEAMLDDIDLLLFCMVDLQGLRWGRYVNCPTAKSLAGDEAAETQEEVVGIAGEFITWDWSSPWSRTMVYMVYKPYEFDVLSDALWRINSS